MKDSYYDSPIPDLGFRRSGRTTRIADAIIQRLFTEGKSEYKDHHYSEASQDYLLDIVIKRLFNEHQITRKHLTIDKRKQIIAFNGVKGF